MPRILFYLFVFCVEILLLVLFQFNNYYDPGDIFFRTSLALVFSLIAGAAFMGVSGNLIIENIINKCDLVISKAGFAVKEERGKTLVGILVMAIITNAGIHLAISTKPSVSYRYIQSKELDNPTLKTLALLTPANYDKVANELKVYINYKNIKNIQKLAIDRMVNQVDILDVARRLSSSYIPGLGESNGFDIIVNNLYSQGRQDMIYAIYKDVLALNKSSISFAGAPAMAVLVEAIEKKEFLNEIIVNRDTPDFIARIVKNKLQKKQ